MNRPIVRLGSAAVGGLAAIAAVGALVLASSGGDQLALWGSTWIIPLLAGASVGVLTWFLLESEPPVQPRDGSTAVVRCKACGSDVRGDWRLCPHCGVSIEHDSADVGTAHSPSGIGVE